MLYNHFTEKLLNLQEVLINPAKFSMFTTNNLCFYVNNGHLCRRKFVKKKSD